eukprot:459076-Prymnesium_polylepis.1
MRTHPVCWNCPGFGHRKPECPSPVGFRPMSSAVTILQTTLARSRDVPSKGAGKGKDKGVPRGRGAAPRGGRGRGTGRF